MSLRSFLDKQAELFEPGGKLEKFHTLWEAQDTILYKPGKVTTGPSHVRDGLDLKRMMMAVVIALIPAIAMAMYNTGYQAHLAISRGAEPLARWQTSAMEAMGLGFDPDVISSDVHSQNIDGPVHNLLHVMSKFMALGMSFEKVIERTTIAPARAIDQTELGHLGIGALGDVTILHQEQGRFDYFDVVGEKITSDNKLVCDGLVIGGELWQ